MNDLYAEETLLEEDNLLNSDKEYSGEAHKVKNRRQNRNKKSTTKSIGDIAKGLESLIVTTGNNTPSKLGQSTSVYQSSPIQGIEKFVFNFEHPSIVQETLPEAIFANRYNSTPSTAALNDLGKGQSNTPLSSKRLRELESSISPVMAPTPKRVRKSIMEPLVNEETAINIRYLVLIVPDSEEFNLFTASHLKKIHEAVLRASKAEVNQDVKFDFADKDRGRYKFVCPNQTARDWALNVVPKLTDLWNEAKIKTVDMGIVPKMIKVSVAFSGKPPNMVDFFEGIENKNSSLNTLHWRVYKKQSVQFGKIVYFLGVDENSIKALKELDYKPYFEASRIKLTVTNNNNHQ